MAPAQNRLIALLPAAERARLLSQCEPVQLALSQVLCERGDTTHHVYFPVDAFVSMVTELDDHPGMEVGMVGREGLLGVQLALGQPLAPLRALVQGPGSAWRLGAQHFADELQAGGSLRPLLDRYLYVRLAQLAASAACLRFHLIGPRLVRWLLMSQDRAHSDQFRVTHEFLAYMLGVRRVGVTVAAGLLQDAGLITYHRGEMTVCSRSGLEAASCSCYASDIQSYQASLGPRSNQRRPA